MYDFLGIVLKVWHPLSLGSK